MKNRKIIRYTFFVAWVISMASIMINRPHGESGTEFDWYACYGPQIVEFANHGTIPIDDFRGPAYQLFVGSIVAFVGNAWETSQFLNIVLSILCIVSMWKLLRSYGCSELTSDIACFAMALTPVFVDATMYVGTDMFFVCVIVMCLYAISQKNSVLTGVLISVAMLTRQNGILLIIPALFLQDKRWIPVVAVAFFVWGSYTLVTTGHFFHSMNYINTRLISIPEELRDAYKYQPGNPMVPSGWFDLITMKDAVAVINNMQSVSALVMTQLVVFPLSVIALFGLRNNIQLLVFGAAFLLSLSLADAEVRYALPLLPLMTIGASEVCEKLS